MPRRQTMEVQMAWLELDKDDKTKAPPPSSRRGPPKLPGLPDIPPMPVVTSKAPAPRRTIEVEMQWVELVDEAKDKREREPQKSPPEAERNARGRPIIPREDD